MYHLPIFAEPEPKTVLSESGDSFFFVLSSGRSTSVAFDAIMHISKCADEVILHTPDKCYSIGHRLKEIYELLPVDRFFRISKDHIVALSFISRISKKRALVNGQYLPISPYYEGPFYNALKNMVKEHYEFYEL